MVKNYKGTRKPLAERLFCLVSAAALLAVCSQSSPLYPFNYWVDSNCFFTMGKAMMKGLVLYRDIYEQKGPLLYFLHGLSYLISNDTFLGVYLFEVLAFASFLRSLTRILRLFSVRAPNLLSMGLGALIATSMSFGLGDSAEEFCLPLISWSLYWMLKLLRKDGGANSPTCLGACALSGLFAGCILWIKFNLLGFHLGWIAVIFFVTLRRQGLPSALKTALAFLMGMLAATLPWIIYFGINRALRDLWTAYFYNNIFLYTIPAGSLLSAIILSVRNFCTAFFDNLGYSILAAAGMLWALLCPRRVLPVACKIGVLTTALLLAAGVYGGGRSYAYYALILSPYSVLGLVPALRLVEGAIGSTKRSASWAGRVVLPAVMFLLILAFSYRFANDTTQLGKDRSGTVHYGFAEVMRRLDERPTLLNYRFLDGGFYTASDITPNCKYFCCLNIPLREMWDAQDEYLLSGAVSFVVTRDAPLDTEKFEKYELVSTGSFHSSEYFLYRLAERA